MLTRCPACATTFRITPEQLKAKLGRVRCGSCASVFNALESLIEEAGAAGMAPRHNVEQERDEPIYLDLDLGALEQAEAPVDFDIEAASQAEPEAEAEAAVTDTEVDSPELQPVAAPSAEDEDDHVSVAEAEHHTADEIADAAPDAVDAVEAKDASCVEVDEWEPFIDDLAAVPEPVEVVSEVDAEPFAASDVVPAEVLEPEPATANESDLDVAAPVPGDEVEPVDAHDEEDLRLTTADALPPPPAFLDLIAPPRARRWPWAIGVVLMLVVLLLQLALVFRVELAVMLPETRPLLERMCGPLDCHVGLPARPELLSIDASDLHPGKDRGQLQLVATLKNRAPFAQEYPNLEVTLTDLADRPLIVRSLKPAEYLSPGSKVDAGFAARSDLSVSLDLDVGDIPAVGYRLYLYYP